MDRYCVYWISRSELYVQDSTGRFVNQWCPRSLDQFLKGMACFNMDRDKTSWAYGSLFPSLVLFIFIRWHTMKIGQHNLWTCIQYVFMWDKCTSAFCHMQFYLSICLDDNCKRMEEEGIEWLVELLHQVQLQQFFVRIRDELQVTTYW